MNRESDSEHATEPKAFPFSQEPPAAPGPETVVNPERRGAASGPSESGFSLPASSVLNRLFPPEPTSEEGQPWESPAGFQLGHFTLESRIGIGGMGAVFRAKDERLSRPVALKVLSPHQSRDSNAVKRFHNEARAAAQLDHENIARVYYIGEDKGLSFIAFEYVTGTTIRELIQQRGQLDPAEAINYTLQIAAALRHTTAAGVVHRDIKPSNIIITPANRAKLVDLGLARKETSEATGELTLAGTTLGTFDYISPEQAKDPRNVDVRSDIYSLGCTLYHMLTGVPPYAEGTVLQKLLDHQGKEPPDPRERNRRVSPELAAIVQTMMASDPARRYAGPDELMADLMRIAGSLELRGMHPDGLIWTSAKSGDRGRFWERHLPWMATAAVLLLIVSLLEFSDIGHQSPGARSAASRSSEDAGPEGNSGTVRVAAGTNEDNAGTPTARPDVPALPNRASGRPGEADSEASASPAVGAETNGSPQAEPAPQPSSSSSLVEEGTEAPVPPDDDAASRRDDQPPDHIFGDPSLPVLSHSRSQDSSESATGGPAPTGQPQQDTERQLAAVSAPKPSLPSVENQGRAGLSSERSDARQLPGAIQQPPNISILGRSKRFPTVEAAVAEASDGDVIELRYNGAQGEPEKPFRVANKKITIRAAKGFQPLIEFNPEQTTGDPLQSRMMTVTQGEVDLIDVDLSFSVGPRLDGERWVLLSLEGADQVRFKGVHVTVSNRRGASAAVFELRPAPGRTLSDMSMMETASSGMHKEFGIRIVESFIRGECELVVVKHSEPGRFDFQQSAVAVSGSLLTVLGDFEMREENDDLELQLEHVTGIVTSSLIRMDSGSEGRNTLPVRVSSRNNILAADGEAPLISMTGNTNPEDFRKRLQWEGRRNFYDGFDVFWSISSSQLTAAAASSEFEFEEWRRLNETEEVDANNEGVIWKWSWRDRIAGFSMITVDDLELLRGVGLTNPAVLAATDGTDVGADLSLLRRNQRPLLPGESASE